MSSRRYRLAFVAPRYHPKGAGGAEVLCRLLAERAAARGHSVEALATCADDHHTWANHFPAGESRSGGVTVRRFPVDAGRGGEAFDAAQSRLSARLTLSREEELAWIEGGVKSSSLTRYLEEHHGRYDFLIFIPYLFGTTYWGARLFPEKSLLIPCLHDEPYAYLEIFRELFGKVRGMLFNTPAEMRLAQRLYGLPDPKGAFVSMGFERQAQADPQLFRRRFKLKDPFILYAGRREKGKNVPLLIEYFRAYKKHTQNDLKLVLIGSGPVDLLPADKGNIFDCGYVSEEEKISATAGALAFCQPSVNESLSIVILQGWLQGVPALVHARCDVTREHCENANAGLYFKEYFEFEECLDYLLANPAAARQMAENGRAYVEKFYNWNAVMERFERALEKFSKENVSASERSERSNLEIATPPLRSSSQ